MSTSTLTSLAQLITSAVSTIEQSCTSRNIPLPSLDEPFCAKTEALRLSDPQVMAAASHIAAAASQLAAIVMPSTSTVVTSATLFHIPSALRAAVETNTAEILREAGPRGLHINEIAAKSKTSPQKLGRVLRLLATEHIFKEVSPDVFANNRISSVLDTGKAVDEILAAPQDKFVHTSGITALVNHFTDDIFKSSSCLTDMLLDPKLANSDEPTQTPFNLAFQTSLGIFPWFELPENAQRLQRFGLGMEGGKAMFNPKAVLQGFDWDALPSGSLVVDVGGGIGSQSLIVAESHPHLNFVVQDQTAMMKGATAFWEANLPGAIESGRVRFQDHNFFTPQPIHDASIYFMRMITHDWADSYCITILSHLRAAAGAHSRLIIVDAIVQYACEDTTVAKDIPGGLEEEGRKAPEPLLPNWGHAALFRYLCDIQMMAVLNGMERTVSQFVNILSASGWRLERVCRSPDFASVHQMLVAVPA
ncbi:S-adenosyl-L-methionine-dependent methyltransferase [Stereum hirsutum FP-91666 SS1]|uniref:S-adenosyl-L-methionine-dependent methyltransferase n=1 Tax=Stereum hirsutum (strain FP-91666) TaxID=721885 RepID=UPI000444A661|nr:S-adenosyl-L-methionine-dependent methyltransferase [Stereum hirsutum FP-91666 SS1]EIM80621.1 S-adenosyl-L-methionine-dependent methyltransferase [Stereum hirsutum FP-91666 SS1]